MPPLARSTLDALQRLFYAARDDASPGEGTASRLAAMMNSDTLRELGREVAMGGVDAPPGLPAACEEASTRANGATGIELWDIAIVLDDTLGDGEIKLEPRDQAHG